MDGQHRAMLGYIYYIGTCLIKKLISSLSVFTVALNIQQRRRHNSRMKTSTLSMFNLAKHQTYNFPVYVILVFSFLASKNSGLARNYFAFDCWKSWIYAIYINIWLELYISSLNLVIF